jgi:hypothetical protein
MRNFYQDFDHFFNTVRKICRNNIDTLEVSASRLLTIETANAIYRYKPNIYTWDLKRDIELICEDRAIKWLIDQKGAQKTRLTETDLDIIYRDAKQMQILPSFTKYVTDELDGQSGCYVFRSKRGKALYVGVSSNLSKRVIGSFRSKFAKIKLTSPIYARFHITPNEADAYILEPYLIAKLKPAYNGTGMTKDKPTFEIPIPKPTKRIQIVK